MVRTFVPSPLRPGKAQSYYHLKRSLVVLAALRSRPTAVTAGTICPWVVRDAEVIPVPCRSAKTSGVRAAHQFKTPSVIKWGKFPTSKSYLDVPKRLATPLVSSRLPRHRDPAPMKLNCISLDRQTEEFFLRPKLPAIDRGNYIQGPGVGSFTNLAEDHAQYAPDIGLVGNHRAMELSRSQEEGFSRAYQGDAPRLAPTNESYDVPGQERPGGFRHHGGGGNRATDRKKLIIIGHG